MKIPGCLTDTLFYLRTLTTLSVLSIGLQMCGQANSTSDVSTFGNSESPRNKNRRVKSESDWKRYYGRLLMNLIKNEFSLETINSEEKYFQYNPPKEKLILKRPDNSSSTAS